MYIPNRKLKRETQFGIEGYRCQDNIKMYPKEIERI
jgi:hypothetical protein